MEIVREHSRVRRLRRRQNLLLEGDPSKYSAWVAKGCLRLYLLDSRDSERIVEFGLEGEFIADRSSFVELGASPYFIDAVVDSEVILFTMQGLDTLVRSIPNYGRMMGKVMDGVLAMYQARVLTTHSLSAEEKYNWLFDQHPRLLQAVPQRMVASYLGVTPATLSRLRGRFMNG